MKRPLGIVALLYAGGLLLADNLTAPLAFIFSLSIATAFAAIVWPRGRPFLLWPLIILFAWANLASRTAIISPNDLRIIERGITNDLVNIRGTLIDTPEERTIVRDEKAHSRTMARLKLSAIDRDASWLPAYGTVQITSPGLLPKTFFAGDTVEIRGVLGAPVGPVAEGLFDYRDYLLRHDIYYELRASGSADWTLVPPARSKPPLADRFLAWSRDTLGRGLPAGDEALELLWSMTLRWKPSLDDEIYEPFMDSGTMHVFAISGLHIAMIAGFLVGILRVVRVPRAWAGLFVIPLIWFYAGVTGWQPSAVRATVMMTIVIGGWALRQPGNLLNSLAAAVLVILVWDPQELFQAGFQLSCFVMLVLAVLLPIMQERTRQWFPPDPFLPVELVPRWRRALRWLMRGAIAYFTVAVAAWLGSAPLTAYYFHILNPVSVLANVLAVPLSMFALAAALGSLLCGAWFPWASVLFNHSAWFWMKLIIVVSQWASSLPAAFWYVQSPSVLTFIVYYSLLLGLASGSLLTRKRRGWTAAGIAVVGMIYAGWWMHDRSTTRITVLPLLGGGCVFVESPGMGDNLLTDTGSTNAVESITVPILRARGVNLLPHLAITHQDVRQTGGLELLCNRVPVGEIDANAYRFRSPVYGRTLLWLRTQPVRTKLVERGDTLAGWTVLHPESTNRFAAGDSASLVLARKIHDTRVLLLSDLGAAGQAVLQSSGQDLQADIVVAGLPDRGEPITDGLLDSIRPKLIIIVDSELPENRKSTSLLEERLARRNVPVIYTRSARAVTVTVRPSRWDVRTMDGQRIDGNTVRN